MNKIRKKFLDNIRVYVKAGSGGNGHPKFGGIGGRGGNVILKVDEKATLKRILSKFPGARLEAGHGGHSHQHRLLGEPGQDITAFVPPGISVVNDHGHVVGELNSEQDLLILANGGPGGNSLNGYTGETGERSHYRLDLKLLADVGLVGFPNAGKSTIMKGLSRCNVKIASYPFTTITPRIGKIIFDDHRQISLADLPGLIEGAHANLGLGHRFLKHVERTRVMLLCIDIMGFKLKPEDPARSAIENVYLLNKELEMYNDQLVTKPCILVVNKIDLLENKSILRDFVKSMENYRNFKDVEDWMRPKEYLHFDEIIPISAKFKPKTVNYLKQRIRHWCDVHEERAIDEKCFMKIQNNLKEFKPPLV